VRLPLTADLCGFFPYNGDTLIGMEPSRASEDRVDIRIATEDKELIETAAALNGQTVSSFIKSVAMKEARALIEQATRTQLSLRDQQRFVEVITGAAEPTSNLKEAAARHRSRIRSK
jgi:uncharacterized protein (DUF1778 family)